jgi:hypothetical protein
MIGGALLDYERAYSGFSSVLELSHFSTPFPIPIDLGSFFKKSRYSFEAGVSFVPVEILESYLEDLLDLQSKDEDLYISHPQNFSWSSLIAVVGMGIAMSIGLFAASKGLSLLSSFAITFILALPFGVLWHFSPRDFASRRMKFAKLLQNEILRRRGGGTYLSMPLRLLSSGRGMGKPSAGPARDILN